jgi:hypothetical protein
MAAMNMVSAGGFWGVSFHLRRCPQGVASVLCKKIPIFGSRRSKFDHLTVFFVSSSVGGARHTFVCSSVRARVCDHGEERSKTFTLISLTQRI